MQRSPCMETITLFALILFAVTYVVMMAFQKIRPHAAVISALIFVIVGSTGLFPGYAYSPLEALKEIDWNEEENNVQAYKHVSRGDATGAIARSKYVISKHFETPWTEHAFLEPECAVAYRDEDGYVRVLSTDQSSHTTLHECKIPRSARDCTWGPASSRGP